MVVVEMYLKPSCPFCHRAKALLDSKGVKYDETDISQEPAKRDEMISRSGRSTVPQIFIAGEAIGGCDDLFALEQAQKLDALLGIAC